MQLNYSQRQAKQSFSGKLDCRVLPSTSVISCRAGWQEQTRMDRTCTAATMHVVVCPKFMRPANASAHGEGVKDTVQFICETVACALRNQLHMVLVYEPHRGGSSCGNLLWQERPHSGKHPAHSAASAVQVGRMLQACGTQARQGHVVLPEHLVASL